MINVDSIKSRIRGESEDARFEAWMELFTSPEAAASEEIKRLLTGHDTLLKILFTRFLAFVSEERAIHFLRDLLFDEDTPVVEAAKKAFDRNSWEGKHKKLIPVLTAPHPQSRVFAMERLSQGGILEAVSTLIKLLAESDNAQTARILTSLRYLPDKRLCDALLHYTTSPNEEIRFKSTLVYGSLYEERLPGAHSQLIKFLSDASPRIRQAAIWALRKQPQKRNLTYFLRLAVTDSDPSVRQECLLGFSAFPSTKVIRILLSVVVHDRSRLVVLKGEAVLLTMPVRRLIRGLKGLLKSSDVRLANKAMLLFAEFQRDSGSYFRWLVKGLHHATNDKDRLPFIEALGIMRNKKALPILERLFSQSPLVAYAALTATLRIWGRDLSFPALKYLTQQNFNSILKQMVLKHFLRLETSVAFERPLIDHLISLLGSSNLNIRYLAAQALSRIPEDFIMEPLLQMMLKETDPSSLKLLRENIAHILMTTPDLFPPVFERYRHNEAAVHLLLTYMRDIPLTPKQIAGLLPKLFSHSHAFLMDAHGEELVGVICHYLGSRHTSVDDVLEALRPQENRNIVLEAIVRRLKTTQGVKVALSIPKFMSEIRTRDDFDKKPLVELLSLSDAPEAIPALVTLSCDDSLTAVRSAASKGLGKVMGL